MGSNQSKISIQIKEKASQIANNYPKSVIAFISLSFFSFSIYALRRNLHKFITYPENGGRHNRDNPQGLRHPSQKGLNSQDIEIQTEGGLILRGWYIKHEKASRILIYYHENAGNIGGRLFYVSKMLRAIEANVLLVSYRGFSDSDGDYKPNEAQITLDSAAIMRKAIQLGNRDKLPVFVFGRSLGGAAAIKTLMQAEFRNSARGLILENTFTSIYDVACNMLASPFYPIRFILWLITSHSYQSSKNIKNLHLPILFIRGLKDTLVPPRLMQKLKQICQKHRIEHFELQIQNGTHNDTWYVGGDRYFSAIQQFLSHCSRL